MLEPRCVHYQFAHVALRGLVFSEPRLATALWELDDPTALLDDIAAQVARACRARGEGDDLRAAELTVHKRRLGRNPCVVIELPQPQATTEAFMIAIIQRRDLDAERTDAERTAYECRYFTLEFSEHRESPHTVLGEWTAQGSHLNMGGGPDPEVEAFVAKLASFVLD
jgi:hypothetical protein